jgi:DNA-binding MarR family transcriptional regulator
MTSPRTGARELLARQAARSFMDLFVMAQSAAFSHWLMFELTFAQARALILLAAHGEMTVGQTARLLKVGKSTASILLQQLVTRGLVIRSEGAADRRVAVVRLSPRGKEIGAGRRRAREAQWRRWMGRLQDNELEALELGLSALGRTARAEISLEKAAPAAWRAPRRRLIRSASRVTRVHTGPARL